MYHVENVKEKHKIPLILGIAEGDLRSDKSESTTDDAHTAGIEDKTGEKMIERYKEDDEDDK